MKKNVDPYSRANSQSYLPVPDRREWDDDIIHRNKRVAMVTRGSGKRINIRAIKNALPWQYFCQSVKMLEEFYADGGTNIAFRDGIIESSHICATLSDNPSRTEVLSSGIDIELLDGIVYMPFLIAWCAVCRCVGCEPYDCVMLWQDTPKAEEMIHTCFHSFDRLVLTRYTDREVFGIPENVNMER